MHQMAIGIIFCQVLHGQIIMTQCQIIMKNTVRFSMTKNICHGKLIFWIIWHGKLQKGRKRWHNLLFIFHGKFTFIDMTNLPITPWQIIFTSFCCYENFYFSIFRGNFTFTDIANLPITPWQILLPLFFAKNFFSIY